MVLSLKKRTEEEKARRKFIRKFLYYFPGGYQGEKYKEWERNYKWAAHLAWEEKLNEKRFRSLLDKKEYADISRLAVGIESKTNLLFSFEKMALRDAVKDTGAAKLFAEGLYNFIYGKNSLNLRFEYFVEMIAQLPVVQTKVLSWPLVTVFGFIARPSEFIFLKPTVTKRAAEKYYFDFKYHSKPNWNTYKSMLEFAELVKSDTAKYKPKDMIDAQSFIWVTGSDEYPD